jgi:threonine/homoserine/homoserine lactone efflux protein
MGHFDLGVLLRSAVIGFSIAAPVGPVGLLCIQRTLARGLVHGLATGLGAASADALYGCMAAFGLTFVWGLLADLQTGLRLVGGAYLCYLGARTLFRPPGYRVENVATGMDAHGLAGTYLSTLLLTLTNPMTVLSFMAIFSGLGTSVAGDAAGNSYAAAATVVLGVFTGSALWWLVLSSLTGLLRSHIPPIMMRWINWLSGLLVAGFGLLMLITLFA